MFLYVGLGIACIVVLIILITSSTKTQLVSDPLYMMAKARATLGILALGYMITFLSNGDITRNFQLLPSDPKLPMSNAFQNINSRGYLDAFFENTGNSLSIVMQTAGIIWFIVAVAMLPFGHSPHDVSSSTTKISEEDTKMAYLIESIHRYVYIYPIRIFGVIFAITFALFVLRLLNGFFFNRSTIPVVSITAIHGVPGPYFVAKDEV